MVFNFKRETSKVKESCDPESQAGWILLQQLSYIEENDDVAGFSSFVNIFLSFFAISH